MWCISNNWRVTEKKHDELFGILSQWPSKSYIMTNKSVCIFIVITPACIELYSSSRHFYLYQHLWSWNDHWDRTAGDYYHFLKKGKQKFREFKWFSHGNRVLLKRRVTVDVLFFIGNIQGQQSVWNLIWCVNKMLTLYSNEYLCEQIRDSK